MSMFMCMLFALPLSSCGDDDNNNGSSSIVGTWECDNGSDTFEDTYILIFKSNGTGSISNTYGSRGTTSEQMNFDWSLTTASDGSYRLSIIYTSGDRDIDGPFEGGYAQYNRTVTIAGKTLSIQLDSSHVMIFHRK